MDNHPDGCDRVFRPRHRHRPWGPYRVPHRRGIQLSLRQSGPPRGRILSHVERRHRQPKPWRRTGYARPHSAAPLILVLQGWLAPRAQSPGSPAYNDPHHSRVKMNTITNTENSTLASQRTVLAHLPRSWLAMVAKRFGAGGTDSSSGHRPEGKSAAAPNLAGGP